MKLANPHRRFFLACLVEISLLGVAVVLGVLCQQPFLATLHWQARDAALGMAGVVPLLVWFWWTLRSRLRPLAEIRDFLEVVVRPIFGQWSVFQLAAISLLAGLCEESLFRAAVQGELTGAFGMKAALALASILFGLCHLVNGAYAVIATFIGLYLGLLWSFTGNLLTPIVTHAVYDFAALIYFLRVRSGHSD